MRAVYIENLSVEESYHLRDEPFHHLVHVARVDRGEGILLLDGVGLAIECEVMSFNKREIVLKKKHHETKNLTFAIDIALGMPKKDALDLCLKQMVELGVSNCYLVRSQYSQMKLPEKERIHKQLISALEQSNSPRLTKVVSSNFDEIDYGQYDQVLVLDSQHPSDASKGPVSGRYLLIIGPEGGFSPEEFSFFNTLPNLKRLNLPTPIMRTPTALSCGVGVILQRLMD